MNIIRNLILLVLVLLITAKLDCAQSWREMTLLTNDSAFLSSDDRNGPRVLGQSRKAGILEKFTIESLDVSSGTDLMNGQYVRVRTNSGSRPSQYWKAHNGGGDIINSDFSGDEKNPEYEWSKFKIVKVGDKPNEAIKTGDKIQLICNGLQLVVAPREQAVMCTGQVTDEKTYFSITIGSASVSSLAPPPCPYGGTHVPILQNHPFKIKAVSGVSSSTARVADYVEFKTMENIYSATNPAKVLFAKDTSIYGIVTLRKHRHFPFVGGNLELELQPLINWDGTAIQFAIRRYDPVDPKTKSSKKDRRGRNEPCKNAKQKGDNCVAGRRDGKVAPVVGSVAAASAAAVGSLAKDDKTRFIAATAFFSIAKDLGDLLSGTDAEISKDDIFDLHMNDANPPICQLLESPKP